MARREKTDFVARAAELGVDLDGPCPPKGTPEWSAYLNAKKQLSNNTPKRRSSRKQREEQMRVLMGKLASEQLETVRHIAVQNLIDLLGHDDPKLRKDVSLAVIDRTDGKPAQTVVSRQDGPVRIVYETAALQVPDFPPLEFTPAVPESDELQDEHDSRGD